MAAAFSLPLPLPGIIIFAMTALYFRTLNPEAEAVLIQPAAPGAALAQAGDGGSVEPVGKTISASRLAAAVSPRR